MLQCDFRTFQFCSKTDLNLFIGDNCCAKGLRVRAIVSFTDVGRHNIGIECNIAFNFISCQSLFDAHAQKLHLHQRNTGSTRATSTNAYRFWWAFIPPASPTIPDAAQIIGYSSASPLLALPSPQEICRTNNKAVNIQIFTQYQNYPNP